MFGTKLAIFKLRNLRNPEICPEFRTFRSENRHRGSAKIKILIRPLSAQCLCRRLVSSFRLPPDVILNNLIASQTNFKGAESSYKYTTNITFRNTDEMWGKVRVKHLLTYYITAVKILTNDGLSSLIEVQQVKAEKGGECRQTAK
jgi:hypothetical protein